MVFHEAPCHAMEQVEPLCESLLSEHNRRLTHGDVTADPVDQVVDVTVSATPLVLLHATTLSHTASH